MRSWMSSPYKESAKNSSPSANFITSGQFLADYVAELKAKEDSDGSESSNVFDVWERQPVGIEEFLYGKKYLDLSITLSPAQLKFVDTLSNIFSETLQEGLDKSNIQQKQKRSREQELLKEIGLAHGGRIDKPFPGRSRDI